MNFTYADMAKMIDHSLLNPTLTVADLEAGCRLALAYDVASVCIMPYYLKRCAGLLRGSTVKASTTIGFPHGGHTTAIKRSRGRTGPGRRLRGTGHGGQHQPGAQRRLGLRESGHCRPSIEPAHAAGPEGESDLRELLSEGRTQDSPMRNLQRSAGRLGEDLDGLRQRRGDDRRPDADARHAAAARPGQGGRRRPRPGPLLEVRALGVTGWGPAGRRRCSTNAAAVLAWGRLPAEERPRDQPDTDSLTRMARPKGNALVAVCALFAEERETVRRAAGNRSPTLRVGCGRRTRLGESGYGESGRKS